MPNRFSNLLAMARRFFRAENANVAMMFGLALVPLTAGAGVGLDLARAMSVRTQLTTALDAAGLAAGGTQGLSEAETKALAQTYFNANYKADSGYGTPSAVAVAINGSSVTVSSSVNMPTTLMAAVGVKTLPINVSITVTRESKKIEIVLALDNTGSMAGDKLKSLKEAAEDLVDTLRAGSNTPANVKFGIVPFSQTVRLDPATALDNNWIDKTCLSTASKAHFDHGYCAYTIVQTMDDDFKWRGCVEARTNGYEILDTAPTTGTPDSLFNMYFQPDEPDDDNDYDNDYIDDGTPKNSSGNNISNPTDSQKQKNPYKYKDKNKANDVNGVCKDLQSVLPLTNDVKDVKDVIKDMKATGMTHVVLGATWGWRLLSSTAPYTQGVAYSDQTVKKILILMTDGDNTMPGADNMNNSEYTAFGYLADNRLGTTSSTSTAETTLDTMLKDACTNIKATGITIYTIGFQIGNSTNTLNLLKNCATSTSHFYNSPTSSALETAFKSIANDISNLRVSK